MLVHGIETYKYYIDRDCNQKFVLYPKNEFFLDSIVFEIFGLENLYTKLSFLCLFTDQYPEILLIDNSYDKKKRGSICGVQVKIKEKKKLYQFLIRFKNELLPFIDLKTKSWNNLILKENLYNIAFSFSPNVFDEYNLLYNKFSELSNLRITFNFTKNQNKQGLPLLKEWFLVDDQ